MALLLQVTVALMLGAPELAWADEPAPAQTRVLLHYEITLDGLSVAQVDATGLFDGSRYRFEAQTRTRGLIDTLVHFRSAAETDGTTQGSVVTPEKHGADNKWQGDDRHVRIAYLEGKVATASVAPTAGEEDRDEVPSDLWTDTVDPLTAAYLLMVGAESASCASPPMVFDGRRLYRFTCNSRAAGQEGAVSYSFEQLRGRQKHPFWPVSRQPKGFAVTFFRPVESLPPIALRVNARAGIAALSVRLTSLTVDGEEIALNATNSAEKTPAAGER